MSECETPGSRCRWINRLWQKQRLKKRHKLKTEQPAQATSSERLGESLSAVMDGEADDLTLRRLIQESATDPELADKWERYHLARDVIHGRGIPVVGLLWKEWQRRLMQRPSRRHLARLERTWPQSLVKFAVAATVAVVAVVTLQHGHEWIQNCLLPVCLPQMSASSLMQKRQGGGIPCRL